MIPRGFAWHSRWWIVAPMAVLLSLLAIIAVAWYEWKLRPLQKYELVGIRLRLLDHSQELVSPRIPAELEGGSVPHLGPVTLSRWPL
jgi:hypothetical protein